MAEKLNEAGETWDDDYGLDTRATAAAPSLDAKLSDAEFYARGLARSRYHDRLFAESRPRPTNEQFDEGWAAARAYYATTPTQPETPLCQCVAYAQYGVEHPRGHVASGCAFAAPQTGWTDEYRKARNTEFAPEPPDPAATVTVSASGVDPSLPTHCDHGVSLDDPCDVCRTAPARCVKCGHFGKGLDVEPLGRCGCGCYCEFTAPAAAQPVKTELLSSQVAEKIALHILGTDTAYFRTKSGLAELEGIISRHFAAAALSRNAQPATTATLTNDPCERCNGTGETEGYGGNNVPCGLCAGAGKRVEFQFPDAPEPPDPAAELCTWSQDLEGVWETRCGQMYEINNGTPLENSMKFCCFCSKPLDEHIYVDKDDDDD